MEHDKNFGSLLGKVALVTGASRGIGRTIARTLGEHGAYVIVNYARNEQEAVLCCREIEAQGGKALAVQFDVANKSQVENVIKGLIGEVGGVDILVNNAGIALNGLAVKFKENDFDKMVEINLKGAFNCSSVAALQMMKKRWGRIINISSVVGQMGNPGQAVYASTKAALIGLTKSLAKEFATRNITVNAVSPGFVKTEMTDSLSETQKAAYLVNIPVGRLGTTLDVAHGVLFFASPMSSYITGQVLGINGGMYI